MQNSSLSLITALYNTEEATDLYKEIYYPIIRYSTVEMYRSADPDSSHYYALTELNAKILELFDINIPTLVLGRAIQTIGRERGMSFQYFSDTTSFRIKDVEDNHISNDAIVSQAEVIESKLAAIQDKFQKFLQEEQLDCDKSFFDFFNDNEKAIECYLNQTEKKGVINEDYVNLTTFISWLQENDTDAYDLLKQVFWGSIIAGFLQRHNDSMGIGAISNVTYYLDTSLIFAVLGYDTIDNVNYARELLHEIHASGATPALHILTQAEILNILLAIEHQGAPDPTSALGEAFYREKKSMSDLLRIRTSLYQILTSSEYKISCPIYTEAEARKLMDKYKNYPEVEQLREKWNSRGDDLTREIHDVALCDIANSTNKYKTNIESYSSYFVTRNMDLVDMFGPKISPAAIIYPANVIMNLWIHSAQSRNLRQSALTEVVTRCMALNQTDVQRRLRIFAKYSKEAELTTKEFQGMYTELIRRSSKAIKSSEIVIENESKEDVQQDKQIELIRSIATEAAESVANRNQSFSGQTAQIEILSKQLEELQKKLETQQSETQKAKETADKEKKKHEDLQPLYEQYGIAKLELKNLNDSREASVSYVRFWFSYFIQWLCLILIIGALGYIIYSWYHKNLVPSGITCAIIFPIAGLVLNLALNGKQLPIFNQIQVGKAKEKQRQLDNWDLVNTDKMNSAKQKVQDLREQIEELGGNITD